MFFLIFLHYTCHKAFESFYVDELDRVLEKEEETLPLATADDVAFDMDTEEMEEDEEDADEDADEIGLEDVLMS